MFSDFKAFLLKENVLALAIAVVIGTATTQLVTAIVADVVMPIVVAATPASSNWRAATASIGRVQFLVGHLLGAVLDFAIIAFVVWRLSRVFIRPKPTAETRPCPFCRQTIDAAATRCAHCTSQLVAA